MISNISAARENTHSLKMLLTGGSGFLGSALALHFLKFQNQLALPLRPASRLSRLCGNESQFNIGRYATDAELDAFIFSVSPDVVIHTACNYGRQEETFTQLVDANVRLGVQILQSLSRMGHPVTFINSGTCLDKNLSPYALTKDQFAQWGNFLATQSAGKIRFVNVRLQHMYGPGDDKSKFTSHVIHACHGNASELLLTAGEQMRDFIHVEDVVGAYEVLIHSADRLATTVEIDIGSGSAVTIREFVQTVHRLTGSTTELRFGKLPYRTNEAMYCQADIEQISRLGWKPKYTLETGLRRTIEMEFPA